MPQLVANNPRTITFTINFWLSIVLFWAIIIIVARAVMDASNPASVKMQAVTAASICFLAYAISNALHTTKF